jgi:perosamine synthetase
MEFFYSHISNKSIEYVNDVLNSGWISEGRKVSEFESSLTKILGFKNPVALNSGTSSLMLALALSDIKSGDEVIIPPQTFVATAMVVLMMSAKPVFADINYYTGNLDPLSVEKKITDKTKAIIAVHWGGYPCDLDELNNIAKNNNLLLIEDAAHALGATYKSMPIGSISRFTAFSFQAIKHLTTGDGGALCLIDDNDFCKAKRLRWFGIDRENSQPSDLGERVYDINELGYKIHMNDIAAAIGLGNIIDIKERINRRREIASIYKDHLDRLSGLELLKYKDDRESSYWFYTILVERRERFIKKLRSENIPCSVVHRRIDKNSIFGEEDDFLVNQNNFDQNQISLPIHENLSDSNIERIIKVIEEGW